jgi:glycosyltransferase involved in cell wall biosynthesis
MHEPWDDVAEAGEWLRDMEARVAPDVVHLNGYVHGALDWHAPVLVVAHSCVLSWWRAVRHEETPPVWDRYRDAVAHGIDAADLVVAPSRAMLAAVAEHYGPPEASRVIPNGRDPRNWQPAPKMPYILAAGRLWDEAKNVAALDRIAAGVPWPVFVAGEQRHPDGGIGRFSGVRQIGKLTSPELARWMSAAAIYALPARYEPFGLSVLDAALSGCALVLGDIPSLREIWGDAALFVPPEDEVSLRDVLLALISDDARRAELATRALARARRELGADRMAARYLEAYRALVTLPRATARSVVTHSAVGRMPCAS